MEEMSMNDQTERPSNRRRVLKSAGVGAVGLVAGLAVGVTLQPARHPQAPAIPGNRRRFEGRVIAITGGTSGIGRAAAEAFAREGGKVTFCGRREALGEEVQNKIRAAGGTATYIRADVRDETQVKAFIDHSVSIYSRLDVAFNNAGITIERPLHEYAPAEWDDVINTNLRGVFLALKYEIPYMLARGGNIVITSSSNAIATTEKRSAYSASKRGLIGLVQSAALDYAQHGIRINALIPGTTDTALVRRSAGMEGVPDAVWELALSQWARSHVPGQQRVAQPEEIAALALTLASDDLPYMTGAQLVIDGGKTAHAG
jgi:NAD(P)-dependent dehydrogenase (short-subunit alcohol dehydrogenase family)